MLIHSGTANQIAAFLGQEQDNILKQLLDDKRSPNTRRAYQKDLTHFFWVILNAQPSPQVIAQFLTLERQVALAVVLKYKSGLINSGLSEATVNRRLAAIKALVRHAHKLGKCAWVVDEIKGEKIQTYRDTTGVNPETFRQILNSVDRNTTKGLRDYAILHLLWSNALRRNEVASADVSDLEIPTRTLTILGKGKGTQKEPVTLSITTTGAIVAWLEVAQLTSGSLFIALDNHSYGHRLTGQGIYNIVKLAAKKAGVNKVMSPHRCRHSAITAALESTGGDVRQVQKFSRHKKVETVLIYDDNRVNSQGAITANLSDLLASAEAECDGETI